MDYRCFLGSFGNSSSASGSSDLEGTVCEATVRRTELLFFVPVVLLSIFTVHFIHFSSVSLSYFILAVHKTQVFGKTLVN